MKGYTAAKVRILYRKMQISLTYLSLVRQCASREGRHVNCGALLVRIFGARRQTDMRPKGRWSPAPADGLSVFCLYSGTVFKIVFREQKICLRYFKIGQTYFEICALYFFLAPMWGKRAENQFSLFRTPNARFSTPVFMVPRGLYGTKMGRRKCFVRACVCLI